MNRVSRMILGLFLGARGSGNSEIISTTISYSTFRFTRQEWEEYVAYDFNKAGLWSNAVQWHWPQEDQRVVAFRF
jgi:hypothetical protein